MNLENQNELLRLAEESHQIGVWDLSHVRTAIELGPLGYISWLLIRVGLRGTHGRVLDAGGGDGYFGALVLGRTRHFLCDFSLIGLSKHHSSTIAVAASLTELPFAEGSLRAALASDVLEHIPAVEVPYALREIARLLAPGGILVINTSCWGIYWRRLASWLRREKGRLDCFDREDGHQNRFAEQELAILFHSAGLQIEHRWHYKHLFQPLLRLLLDEPLKRILGGRRKGKVPKSLIQKTSHVLRVGDWLRAGIALADVLCFGWWLAGGATVWRLRKPF